MGIPAAAPFFVPLKGLGVAFSLLSAAIPGFIIGGLTIGAVVVVRDIIKNIDEKKENDRWIRKQNEQKEQSRKSKSSQTSQQTNKNTNNNNKTDSKVKFVSNSKSIPTVPIRHYISRNTGPDYSPTERQVPLSTRENVVPTPNLPSFFYHGTEHYAERHFETNDQAGGRVEYMRAVVNRTHLTTRQGTAMKRETIEKKNELGNMLDDAGHLLAARFSGQGVINNMIPQNKDINRRNWRLMEKMIAQDVLHYDTVNYSIRVLYSDNDSTRPYAFIFKVETTDGRCIRYGYVDNPPTTWADAEKWGRETHDVLDDDIDYDELVKKYC